MPPRPIDGLCVGGHGPGFKPRVICTALHRLYISHSAAQAAVRRKPADIESVQRRSARRFGTSEGAQCLSVLQGQPRNSDQQWRTVRSTASVAVPEAFRYIFGAIATTGDQRKEAVMDWARILAYVTGTVDQELQARARFLPRSQPSPGRTRSWPGTASWSPVNSLARRLVTVPADRGSSARWCN
jgi:hypothetical protein